MDHPHRHNHPANRNTVLAFEESRDAFSAQIERFAALIARRARHEIAARRIRWKAHAPIGEIQFDLRMRIKGSEDLRGASFDASHPTAIRIRDAIQDELDAFVIEETTFSWQPSCVVPDGLRFAAAGRFFGCKYRVRIKLGLRLAADEPVTSHPIDANITM